jgi:hypothetical protein
VFNKNKRKYGLGSDYILNFKNNILFKSRRNSNDTSDNNNNNNTNTSINIHSSILQYKKANKNNTSFTNTTKSASQQQPQYQLGIYSDNNRSEMPSSLHQTEIMSKNPTFNYGIIFFFFLVNLCLNIFVCLNCSYPISLSYIFFLIYNSKSSLFKTKMAQ